MVTITVLNNVDRHYNKCCYWLFIGLQICVWWYNLCLKKIPIDCFVEMVWNLYIHVQNLAWGWNNRIGSNCGHMAACHSTQFCSTQLCSTWLYIAQLWFSSTLFNSTRFRSPPHGCKSPHTGDCQKAGKYMNGPLTDAAEVSSLSFAPISITWIVTDFGPYGPPGQPPHHTSKNGHQRPSFLSSLL
jgi:hypothetical protein